MIALILAAGRGSRLGSYTDNIPKSLLPLNDSGKTILDYNLSILQERLDLEKIIIVTGYKSEQIERVAAKYDNTVIVYNPFWEHCNVLGSMYMALDHLDDDFLFLHADTLMEEEAWLVLSKSNNGDIILPYEKKQCGAEEMKVIIDDNSVTCISKEFDPLKATGEFVGIALFKRTSIPYFKQTASHLFKKGDLNYYMEAVLQCAIDDNSLDIRPLDITKFNFVEVDFEEDYIIAKKTFG